MPPEAYRRVLTTDVAYVDACAIPGHTHLLFFVNDGFAHLGLPFSFRFWDLELPAGSEIALSSDGYVAMSGFGPTFPSPSIPSTDPPNLIIAPYLRDLHLWAGGICVVADGAAPDRRLVIDWHEAATIPWGNIVSFSVTLHEGSNAIDVAYGTMGGGLTAAVGLEDERGTRALGGCPDGSTECLPQSNTALRFVPNL